MEPTLDSALLSFSKLMWRAYERMPCMVTAGDEEDELELDYAALVRYRSRRRATAPQRQLAAALLEQCRPRMLCLHGRGSNNDITRYQLAHTRIVEYVDCCDLLHAPFPDEAQSGDFDLLSELPFHAWWRGSLSTGRLAKVLRLVLRHIERSGPYDGLYGFSQGAAIVTLLSLPGMVEALGGSVVRPWRFVVCGCGVALGLEQAAALCEARTGRAAHGPGCITLPSLHLIGRWDVYCRASSIQLTSLYAQPKEVTHGNGHALPSGIHSEANVMGAIQEFFEQVATPLEQGDAAGIAPAAASPYKGSL